MTLTTNHRLQFLLYSCSAFVSLCQIMLIKYLCGYSWAWKDAVNVDDHSTIKILFLPVWHQEMHPHNVRPPISNGSQLSLLLLLVLSCQYIDTISLQTIIERETNYLAFLSQLRNGDYELITSFNWRQRAPLAVFHSVSFVV